MSLPEPPTASAWPRVRVLLVALVLARGLVLLCVLPPFEGWDEYQHVGYVAHVASTGQAAVLGQTAVPRPLLDRLASFPHPGFAIDQIGWVGAVGYGRFWDGPATRPAPKPGPAFASLYQAQHGPLYYQSVGWIFEASGGLADLPGSISALRLVNLLLTASAVWLALGVFRRLFVDPRHATLAGLLLATQPLFLFNGVRVASDALGVLLATAAIAASFRLNPGRNAPGWFGVGVLVGLAILAKAVNLALVPAIGAGWLLRASSRDRPAGITPLLLSATMLVVGAGMTVQGELRRNLSRFGMLTPMQEGVVNLRAGKTTADLLAAARRLDWPSRWSALWLDDGYFQGGWSFLNPGTLQLRRHRTALLACLVGWGFLALPRARRRPPIFRDPHTPLICLAVCVAYTAALSYHMAQSQLAWGVPTTNPWYACPAYPWALVLATGGALLWPLGRYRVLLPAYLVVTSIVTETVVVLGRMIPFYSGWAHGIDDLARLSGLHPSWAGTPTLIGSSLAEMAILGLLVVAWIRMRDSGQATSMISTAG